MDKLLLHVCCGPCSTHAIKELEKDFELTLYFYNPNLYPEEEYNKRLEAAQQVAKKMGIDLIEGKYELSRWEPAVKGYEKEPEGGVRCERCVEFRLQEAARMAKGNGFTMFGTTLTVGPMKKASQINSIGKRIAKGYSLEFLGSDFKKKDGFLRSVKLSKEMGIYRQDYCGCLYSLRSSMASPRL